MSDQNINKFYITIFTLSFFSLFAAFYVEYILGFKPCILCIYQWIPYAIAILISLTALFTDNKIPAKKVNPKIINIVFLLPVNNAVKLINIAIAYGILW